ncbi:Probable ubiquitin-conjugating enzyme E2 23 [Dionaea muscipula]
MDHQLHDDVSNACQATLNESSYSTDMSSVQCGPDVGVKVHVDEILSSVNPDKLVYMEDVVRGKGSSLLGVVTEVAGDSDSESEITDDEDDDDGSEDAVGVETGKAEVDDKTKIKNSGGDDEAESRNGSNDREDSLSPNQVRVIWMDNSETVSSVKDLTVVDRGFLHGDYVASELDRTGQVGIVSDVNISVELLAPDGSILSNVSSRDLKHVRDITVGDYVVLGPWLGRVDDVLDDVFVLFDDGSACKVEHAEPLQLRPMSKNLFEDGHCPYYPGQRVRASSSSVFKYCRFLTGSWKANRLEGTVTKVTVGSVYVHWIASAGYGSESSTTPTEDQDPKKLKLLSCFTYANWQLGDWCLLPSSPMSISISHKRVRSKLRPQNGPASVYRDGNLEDIMLNKSNNHGAALDMDGSGMQSWDDRNVQSNTSQKLSSCSSSVSVSKDGSWHVHRKKLRKVVVKRDKKPHKKEESFERAFMIIHTRTTVDVAWQDGTIERGLNSTSLIPIESPGDHDFVAEEYVIEKGADESDDSSEIRRVGVVKSVSAKEKTASVIWLKPVASPEDAREFDKEETVSVYELEGHPDYDYCYGDVVVRLSPISVLAETARFDPTDDQGQPSCSTGVEGNQKKCSSHSDVDDANVEEAHAESSDLSWVGNITGLKNGDIEVTWADGMVSTVGPQAIYVVGRDDDDDASIANESEISDDRASWETVEDDDAETSAISEKVFQSATSTSTNPDTGKSNMAGDQNAGISGPLSIPLAALGFFARVATGIFSRGRKNEVSSSSGLTSEARVHSPEGFCDSDASSSGNRTSSQESPSIGQASDAKVQIIGDVDSSELLDVAEDLSNLRRTNEHQSLSCHEVGGSSFKRFDTAEDPFDNFFLGSNLPSNSSRKWHRKLQQDWHILQNNLPDGIYVRVYEDRMDLLRAVIVGAYGTPYQDGLFFFDFHLPPEYPDVPPSAHYHSGGWRINPNLYEEGKVCLSLLNTWTGKGNEVWDPKSSSILQVLVSLQGLVLNSKPYFNEAGYDKQIGTAEGEKNSLSYNENTFLLNCKTMMYLLRKPPKDFEDLVKDHFKRRGYYILKACDAYMKGYLIGSLSKDASITDKSDENATSVGFKLMLAKIVPRLFSALSELEVDCNEFKHLQQV